MKSFVNYEGSEIFRLDDFGNLWLMGNLTLGTHGILTSPGGVIAPSDEDMCLVRDPREMEPPFLREGSAIYYLGESVAAGDTYTKDGVEYQYSQAYTYGAWYEKYVYGYDCEIDADNITLGSFSIPSGATFRALDNTIYAHNKEVLDRYPSTVKIVVTPVPPENEGETGYWEIKYYDVDNNLLFTDIPGEQDGNGNYTSYDYILNNSSYHFPFTPQNVSDWGAESADIVINVTTVYATREINPVDFSLYMPYAGGTFKGAVYTQDITPDPLATVNGVNPYNIGTNENRYFKGYFNEVVAKTVSAEVLSLETLNIDAFGLSEGKGLIVPGDVLIIGDVDDDGNLKRATGIAFTADKTRYLRQDGVFEVPTVALSEVTSFENAEERAGTMVYYTGANTANFTKNVIYLGIASQTEYQIIMTGVTFNGKVANAGITATSALNHSSRLIAAINALGLGTIAEALAANSSVTLIYSVGAQGWYVKGKEGSIVPKNTTLAGATNAELINELLINNSLYDATDTDSSEITIKINKFLWKPNGDIQFDGVTTNKYLSKAGTWETVPTGGGGGGSSTGPTPASGDDGSVGEEYHRYIIADVSISNATGEVMAEGLNALETEGVFEVRNSNGKPEYTVAVKKSGVSTIYQTVTKIKWNEGFTRAFSRTIPDTLMRKGTKSGNLITWENWTYVYNNAEVKVALSTKGTWRTLTKAEWEYLLSSRTNAASLWGLATIGTIPGIVILDDAGTLPSIENPNFTSGDAEGFTTNQYSIAEWNKYYNGLALFLPVTGKRAGTVVTKTKDKATPTAFYWTATQSQAYSEGVADAKSYALSIVADAITYEGLDYTNGLAVRLARTSADGAFSVASGRKVIFSKGNLQYHPANGIFRFAKNQYDTIDEFNMNIDAIYDGWIDLFGFGTSGLNNTTFQIVNHSTDPDDYAKVSMDSNPNMDWGVWNSIYSVDKPSIASCLEEDY